MIIKARNGQSSIEFLILVVSVLFFFVIFLLAVQTNISDKIKDKYYLEIRETALTVQDEINLALDSSDGYLREFNLPDKIINKDYIISLTSGFVYVRTNDEEFAIALSVGSVTGEIQKGVNFIRKTSGKVYLNS